MHTHPPSPGGRAAPGKLATLFQRSGESYVRARRLPTRQAKVLRAVSVCRTAAAGGHRNVCQTCGYTEQAHNSCRDRHCPTCQWRRQQEWIAARMARMLPVPHFHVVFTLPAELRPLAAFNASVVYDKALKAAAQTLTTLCADRLGLLPGVTVVLHTWTRELLRHPHVHCIVSAGGEDLDRGGWKPVDRPFLLPVAVMASLFRGKLLNMLKAADRAESLTVPDDLPLRQLLAPLHNKRWVVYAKAPLRDRRNLVRYLGAYTHRVAISERRVVRLGDHDITFRARNRRTVTLNDEQFLDRYRLHILPRGLRKIRHYGLYAPTNARRVEAVGDDYVSALDDIPPHADAPQATRRGRVCPACEDDVLVYGGLLLHPPPILDSS